ncbi:MAG: ACP S-malonyltransferase [Deltaproteobacteria bacterium]|nr:MAG: ACP S-malonyltransferase [Deltaproteobacteria bacterium]
MTLAVLFPGQGALPRRQPQAVLETPALPPLLDTASKAMGEDLARLVRRGAHLTRTDVAQPLLAVACMAVWPTLRDAREVAMVAGHSFGDFLALAAAADLDPHLVVELAVERGRAFAEAARGLPGDLLALTPASTADPVSEAEVEALLAGEPSLVLAAHNAPREWVVSGPPEALQRVQRTHGGRRLQVGGPWHHPGLDLTAAPFGERVAPHVPARLARPYVSGLLEAPTHDGARALATMVLQCTAPVRWAGLLGQLHDCGVSRLAAVGPGRVLRALAHHNGWRREDLHLVGTPDEVTLLPC